MIRPQRLFHSGLCGLRFLLPVNKQRNSLGGKSINVQTFIVMAFLEVQTFQTVWWH